MPKKRLRIVLEGFTVSVTKFVIEQENETDGVPSLNDGVREAIGRVISAPAQLLTLEANGEPLSTHGSVDPISPTGEQRTKKRRRRVHRTLTEGEPAASGDESDVDSLKVRAPSHSNSARTLILEIQGEGFFAQDRPIAEIRDELHTRGHSFKSNELSPPLLALTKQKLLARRRGEKGKWTYRDGASGKR